MKFNLDRMTAVGLSGAYDKEQETFNPGVGTVQTSNS